MYSYESDFSFGGEWWIGRRRGKRDLAPIAEMPDMSVETIEPVVSRPAPNLRAEEEEAFVFSPPAAPTPASEPRPVQVANAVRPDNETVASQDRDGVLKARVSGNWVSLCPISVSL